MERLTIPDKPIEGGIRRAVVDARTVKEQALTLYWALKKYEDTGLTPEEIMDSRMLTGWIPVEERLPDVKIPADFDRQTYSDFGKCFLITDRRGFVYTATFHVIANKFDYDAVAWMPLPEPYKVDK